MEGMNRVEFKINSKVNGPITLLTYWMKIIYEYV